MQSMPGRQLACLLMPQHVAQRPRASTTMYSQVSMPQFNKNQTPLYKDRFEFAQPFRRVYCRITSERYTNSVACVVGRVHLIHVGISRGETPTERSETQPAAPFPNSTALCPASVELKVRTSAQRHQEGRRCRTPRGTAVEGETSKTATGDQRRK
eukprot:GHVT01035540.1.p1 GENE.GHVT01035540.1~~GHVT01035540.1.p1  ORF type:complete len:155 (+),score=4.30 GHVT01035540.1:364-828(+)